MDKVILEIHHHGRSYPEITFVGKDVIKIGRSFLNDIYCPDQYVGDFHAEIRFDGTEWRLCDLGGENGTIVGGRKIEGNTAISSGDQFSVGKTKIKFYKADHPVPPAHRLAPASPAARIFIIAAAWILAFLLPFLQAAGDYLATFNGDAFLKLLPDRLSYLLIPIGWAFFWAAVGKLTIRTANYHVHLLGIGACLAVEMVLLEPLRMIFEYNSGNTWINGALRELFMAATIYLAFYASLRFSTHLKQRALSILPLLIALVLTVAVDSDKLFSDEFKGVPSINSRIMNREFLFRKAKSLDYFMSQSEKLFREKELCPTVDKKSKGEGAETSD